VREGEGGWCWCAEAPLTAGRVGALETLRLRAVCVWAGCAVLLSLCAAEKVLLPVVDCDQRFTVPDCPVPSLTPPMPSTAKPAALDRRREGGGVALLWGFDGSGSESLRSLRKPARDGDESELERDCDCDCDCGRWCARPLGGSAMSTSMAGARGACEERCLVPSVPSQPKCGYALRCRSCIVTASRPVQGRAQRSGDEGRVRGQQLQAGGRASELLSCKYGCLQCNREAFVASASALSLGGRAPGVPPTQLEPGDPPAERLFGERCRCTLQQQGGLLPSTARAIGCGIHDFGGCFSSVLVPFLRLVPPCPTLGDPSPQPWEAPHQRSAV
jgi:hypothetical protein